MAAYTVWWSRSITISLAPHLHAGLDAPVAGRTASLPEAPGAGRNWNYRYGWIRDASLTLRALWVAACPDEASTFLDWLVGNVDRCAYCQSAHTLSAKRAGLTEEQTVAVREGLVDFDPKLAALLTLVRVSASDLGHVSDDVWHKALGAGRRDTELTEVSVHIALNLCTNHVNHLVQTDLDLPAAPGL